MKVFITGGTGFIGKALVQRLLGGGHRVSVLTRSPEKVPAALGAEVEAVDSADDAAHDRAVAEADAVINLAGENVLGGRWTEARKRRIEQSRLRVTTRLVDAMRRAPLRPSVLLSTSGVDYYPEGGPWDETGPASDDFLGRVCERWEESARSAEVLGVRVAIFRVGVVLGAEGGMLGQVLPIFRLGLGGRLGSGHQPLSWIHLTDLVEMFTTALGEAEWSGVINAVAPDKADNRGLTRALSAVVGRPAVLPAPAFAVKLVFGEGARVVLGGRAVECRRARELGFRFEHPRLGEALASIVEPDGGPRARRAPGGSPKGARYLLEQSTVIEAPVEDVFDFFSKAENLGVLTPEWMKFRVIEAPARIEDDVTIDYRIRVGPLPMKWRTRIRSWERGERFVDEQENGPYSLWWHEHTFTSLGERTEMQDRVYYTLPLGPLGRLVHALNVRATLLRIFSYRNQMIALRFPLDGSAGAKKGGSLHATVNPPGGIH